MNRQAVKRLAVLAVVITLLVMVLPPGCVSDSKATPEAAFSVDSASSTLPLEVQFADQSTGEITGWEWDLNDDGVIDSTEQNPAYTYNTTGEYTVSLKVTGPGGSDTAVKTQYISVSKVPKAAVVYPELKLDIGSEFLPNSPEYKSAEKFKELLELYTDGKVTVDIYGPPFDTWGRTGILQKGDLDMAWINPYYQYYQYYLKIDDPNLEWIYALPNSLISLAHGRAVLEDGRLAQFAAERLLEANIHFLGYFEGSHFMGTFNTVKEVRRPTDMAGLRIFGRRSQSIWPYFEYCGLEPVAIPFEEMLSALATGKIDATAIPIDRVLHGSQDYSDILHYVNHGLLQIMYSVYTPLMNLDTWNSLGADLQALITDVIVPEVKAFSVEESFRQERATLLDLMSRMDTLHFQSTADSIAVYEEIKNYDSYRAALENLDPIIPQIIMELRPVKPVMDPEIAEVLEYAGIPVPE